MIIKIDYREFPSNVLIETGTQDFEPEVTEFRDSEGHRIGVRVEPYRLVVRSSIVRGLSLMPGPSGEYTAYQYMFTIWRGGWFRDYSRVFNEYPIPVHFVAYYLKLDRQPTIDGDTVHTYAVSLRSKHILEDSPITRFHDGVITTSDGQQIVEARSPLRDEGSISGVDFFEWTAWTSPPAIINPPITYEGGFTIRENRMTLERNTFGMAVAFYDSFPEEPPLRENAAGQAPQQDTPFEEMIRQVAERGDVPSVRKAIQDTDVRIEQLRQMQKLLKQRLEHTKA